jgi:acetylornithine deacetylase
MSDVIELTKQLVSIPSHEDETVAGDAIESWLTEHTDAEVTRDEVGNVLARRGTGERSLALVGHHDVVPPADEQLDGEAYVVEERDGRVYGRGTADMKGCVAAAMVAFRDADPSCELHFASFVGEETGGLGAIHATENGFVPDFAIVGEGSTNYSKEGVTDVVVAHRGRRGHEITVHGRAAHASEPEAGVNAIYRSRAVLDVYADLEFPTATVHGMTFNGSAVVTKIRDGGNPANEIPHEVVIEVDERTVPGVDVSYEAVTELEGVDVEMTDGLPPMACDDDEFARTVLAAAEDAQDGRPELTLKPHATDAGRLALAGTTCVVCGASEPGEAHTATESAGVDVLERCYRIYRNAAERV